MIGSITEIWTAVATWIVSTISSILPIFYNATDDELTILGVLVIVTFGVAIFLLLMSIVTRFFSLRQ